MINLYYILRFCSNYFIFLNLIQNLFENNFDTIKSNKSIIKNDADLRVRIEILNQRLNDFLKNL